MTMRTAKPRTKRRGRQAATVSDARLDWDGLTACEELNKQAVEWCKLIAHDRRSFSRTIRQCRAEQKDLMEILGPLQDAWSVASKTVDPWEPPTVARPTRSFMFPAHQEIWDAIREATSRGLFTGDPDCIPVNIVWDVIDSHNQGSKFWSRPTETRRDISGKMHKFPSGDSPGDQYLDRLALVGIQTFTLGAHPAEPQIIRAGVPVDGRRSIPAELLGAPVRKADAVKVLRESWGVERATAYREVNRLAGQGTIRLL